MCGPSINFHVQASQSLVDEKQQEADASLWFSWQPHNSDIYIVRYMSSHQFSSDQIQVNLCIFCCFLCNFENFRAMYIQHSILHHLLPSIGMDLFIFVSYVIVYHRLKARASVKQVLQGSKWIEHWLRNYLIFDNWYKTLFNEKSNKQTNKRPLAFS